MKKQRDIENKSVYEENGLTIIRSVARDYDSFTEEYSGHKKVWYDVCDDEDILGSFKTLREAKKYLKEIFI